MTDPPTSSSPDRGLLLSAAAYHAGALERLSARLADTERSERRRWDWVMITDWQHRTSLLVELERSRHAGRAKRAAIEAEFHDHPVPAR